MDPLMWAAPATPHAPEPETKTGIVAAAGARTLCEHAGINYDNLDGHGRDHYAEIALQMFVAMWHTAVEVGMTVAVETVTAAGEPVEVPQ